MCSVPIGQDLWKWHHVLQLRHPTLGSVDVRGQSGQMRMPALFSTRVKRVVRGPVRQDVSTCQAGMSGRMLVFWGAWDRLRFYAFVSKCVRVCVSILVFLCVLQRERQQLQKPGSPPGCTRRQPQLDASRGGQDVLTASWGRWKSKSGSGSCLRLIWTPLKMARRITSGLAVINTFQGFVEG